MYFIDKLGWPVERVKDRWLLNFLRLLIHTRKVSRKWIPPTFSKDNNTEELSK